MDIVLSLFPLDPIGLASLVAVFLAMFALGADVHPSDLLRVRADARAVVLTLAAALVAVPVATLVAAIVFGLHSAFLAGVLLVGISPGAPLALRRAHDAGAHVPFALTVQVLVALLAIVAVPVWILILNAIYDRGVAVSVAALAKQVFMAQLLPLCCGLLFATLAP
jgi:BASS family bile acid:Na+ symporter